MNSFSGHVFTCEPNLSALQIARMKTDSSMMILAKILQSIETVALRKLSSFPLDRHFVYSLAYNLKTLEFIYFNSLRGKIEIRKGNDLNIARDNVLIILNLWEWVSSVIFW